MLAKYVLQDELGNSGQTIAIRQGEIKIISVYLFNPDGTPKKFASVAEIIVKIFTAAYGAPVKKQYSLSAVTLISGLSGTIGFSFTLTAADTNSLPVSSTIGMSATVQDSTSAPTYIDEIDFPAAFNVTPPAVV